MGLNVAMISTWATRCGIYTYVRNLSTALAKLGVNVYICRLPRFGHLTPELLQNVVDTIPKDCVDLIHHQEEYGLMKNLEHEYFTSLKRLGKPIICTCHSVGAFEIDRVIAEVSSRVIVHNEFCARHFGYPEKTVIIPHGCLEPVNCPPADECKRQLGIDPKAPLVGYVGFISPPKGVDILVEAMRGVPEAALLIGGGWFVEAETSYIMNLKQYSLQALPRRCQWLGYVPDERLPIVYGAMDLLVYPSRFISESGALLMALSHGKAVLASSLPPVKEKERLGALMTFKSVEDLRRKIKLLLKDKELRHRLEQGARKYAEANSWSPYIAEKHVKLYRDVVKR